MFNFGQRKANGRPRPDQDLRTVLGEGTRWQGDLEVGLEGLRIEGTFEGTLQSLGDVTVAASGLLKGTVQARNLIVSGRVDGLVKVEACLEVRSTGWVEGEVELGTLVVDEGGTLQGTCIPRSASPEVPPPPPSPRRDDRFAERPFAGPVGSDLAGPPRTYDKVR